MNTMQFLNAVLAWLQADPAHVMVAASTIAMLTPTPAPNTTAGRLYKVVEMLALNFMHAKETGITTAALAEQVVAILEKKQTSGATQSAQSTQQ